MLSPGGNMINFLVTVIWVLITAALVKYSLYFGFDNDAGIAGPIIISVTILWLYAFFKHSSKSK